MTRDDHQPERSEPRSKPDAEGSSAPGGVELAPGVWCHTEAIRFSASRSSGPGGQNVNKRSTRVELRVAVADIEMPGDARTRLKRLAGARLTSDGELLIASDEHRSQKRNKDECLERLRELLVRAMVRPKPRKKTKPTKGSQERRLQGKREQSERKARRRRSEGE